LIAGVRDEATDSYRRLPQGANLTGAWRPLRFAWEGLTVEQRSVADRCVHVAIDGVLGEILQACQQAHDLDEGIEIVVDGENMGEVSDGLNGEQYGEFGWYAKFGKYPPLGRTA
jgi:hypothetical protein